ncbi:MAG: RibD family protein [Polyangiales bacterium]
MSRCIAVCLRPWWRAPRRVAAQREWAKGLSVVELKVALSLDGRMATRGGDARWITGPEARTEVHRMRARVDAIMVGSGTVLADDPMLDVRQVRGRHPRVVLLDGRLRTPPSARLLRHPGRPPALIVHRVDADAARHRALTEAGGVCVALPASDQPAPQAIRRLLFDAGLRRVLLEGGPTVVADFLAARAVQYVTAFIAPCIVGDPAAPGLFVAGAAPTAMAAAMRLQRPWVRHFGADVGIEGVPILPQGHESRT